MINDLNSAGKFGKPEDVDAAFVAQDSQFNRGLRSATLGMGSQLQTVAGAVGDAVGAPEFAQNRFDSATALRGRAEAAAPRVNSISQINGLRDFGDYATGLMGAAIPSVAAVGIPGMFAKTALGAVAAGTAGLTAFETGDVMQRRQDAGEAPSLLRDMPVGVGSALLGSVVPGMARARLAGRGVPGTGGPLAVIPEAAAGEALAETTKQVGSGQELDPMRVADAAAGGAVMGAPFAGMAAVGDALHGRPGAAPKAPGAPTVPPGGAEGSPGPAGPPPGPAQRAADAASALFAKVKGRFRQDAAQVEQGLPAGDLRDLADKQGADLNARIADLDGMTMEKVKTWATELSEDAGLTPEKRERLAEAMQDLGNEASQRTVAALKKGREAGKEAAEIASRLYTKMRKLNDGKPGDVVDMEPTTPRARAEAKRLKSEDFSGIRAVISEHMTPALEANHPDIFDDPKALQEAGDSVRMFIEQVAKKEPGRLDSDTVVDLIDLFGDQTTDVLNRVFTATMGEDRTKAEQFFGALNQITEIQKRDTSLSDVMRKNLKPEFQEAYTTRDLRELTNQLRGWVQNPDKGKSQEDAFFDQKVTALIAEQFDKPDAVFKVLEREARDTKMQAEKEGRTVDNEDGPEGGFDGDPRDEGQGELAPRITRLKDEAVPSPKDHRASFDNESQAERFIREAGAPPPGTSYRWMSAEDYHERTGTKPDVLDGDLRKKGYVVAERMDDSGALDARGVQRYKFDTKRGDRRTSQSVIDAGDGLLLDAMKLGRIDRGRELDWGSESGRGRLAEVFFDNVAAVQASTGKTFNLNDKTVVGARDGNRVTVGDLRKLDKRTEADKAHDAKTNALIELRKEYRATEDEQVRKAIRKEAEKLAADLDYERTRDALRGDDTDNGTSDTGGGIPDLNKVARREADAQARTAEKRGDVAGTLAATRRADDLAGGTELGNTIPLGHRITTLKRNLEAAEAKLEMTADRKLRAELRERITKVEGRLDMLEKRGKEIPKADGGEGRTEVGKDEQIHTSAKALKDEDLVQRVNLDGTPKKTAQPTNEDKFTAPVYSKPTDGSKPRLITPATISPNGLRLLESLVKGAAERVGTLKGKNPNRLQERLTSVAGEYLADLKKSPNALSQEQVMQLMSALHRDTPLSEAVETMTRLKESLPPPAREAPPLEGFDRVQREQDDADNDAALRERVASDKQAAWVERALSKDSIAETKAEIDKLNQTQLDALATWMEDNDPPAGVKPARWAQARSYAVDRSFNQEAPPDPKAVAAKKAAFLEKALSGDKELLKELASSDDAKGLQRAVEALKNKVEARAVVEAINKRLGELVQNPDVAYGMGLGKKYSLMGVVDPQRAAEWRRDGGSIMVHYTFDDNLPGIKQRGYRTDRPAGHKLGGGGKNLEALYFNADANNVKWTKGLKEVGAYGGSMDDVFFDYESQQWVTIPASLEPENMGRVAAVLNPTARLLEINSAAEARALLGNSREGVINPLAAFAQLAKDRGLDGVKIGGTRADWREPSPTPGRAPVDRLRELTGDSDIGDHVILNAKAVALHSGVASTGERVFSRGATNQASTMGPAEKRAVLDYINTVLGPSISVAFKKFADMPHAGEFEAASNVNPADIIRLSVHALNPMATAHHEALHAWFKQLTDKGLTAVMRPLLKAADSPAVRARLEQLLANEPAALRQLDNAEERVAYMYQFWSTGQLTLGEQPTGIFGRMAQMIRDVLGIWSNDERALKTLEYFESGGYKADAAAPSAVLAATVEQGMPKALRKAKAMTEPLMRLGDELAVAGGQRLRDTGVPALVELARLVKATGREADGDAGFIPAARVERTRIMNNLAESLRGLDQAGIRDALEHLQGGPRPNSTQVRVAAAAVRKVLQDARQYMLDAGVSVADLGERYFPRVYDADYISRHQQEFVTVLERHGVANARGIMHKIVSADGNEFQIETDIPGMQHKKERKLHMVPDAELAPFMQKDLLRTVNSYVTQATRRAEWARRFNDDSSKIASLLAEAKRQGADKTEVEAAQRYVRAVNGTLGDDINPSARRLFGDMMVYQNIRLLPLAIFSSVVDPMGIMVRGGTVKDAFATFKRGVKEVTANFKSDPKFDAQTELAATLGVIDNAMLSRSLGALYSQGMVGDTGRKINDAFFRYNLMEQWNQSARVGATQGALRFIARHGSGTATPHSKRWMQELGLEPADVQLKADGSIKMFEFEGLTTAQAAKVRVAVNRWVDGAVLRPDAADKPMWMNDPHFALVAHLKQFVFSFHETIIKRVIHEAENRNYQPAMALAGYVPMMIAADMVKGVIQGGGSEPEWKQDWTAADYIWSGVQRAGLLGTGQFLADMAGDAARGGSGVGALAGPTIDQFADAVSVLNGQRSFESFALKSLPANALYAGVAKGGEDEAPFEPRAD